MILLRTLKLTVVDYWWKSYRKLDKRTRSINPVPLKWFVSTYKVLRKRKYVKENKL